MDQNNLLSLKWNNHLTTFSSSLKTLRNEREYADATIACEGKTFPVHRLVLSMCSEYFVEIFKLTIHKYPVIVLKDIKARELEALLNYMYLGEVNVLQEELPGLIQAAECLRIKGLAVPDDEILSEDQNRKRLEGGSGGEVFNKKICGVRSGRGSSSSPISSNCDNNSKISVNSSGKRSSSQCGNVPTNTKRLRKSIDANSEVDNSNESPANNGDANIFSDVDSENKTTNEENLNNCKETVDCEVTVKMEAKSPKIETSEFFSGESDFLCTNSSSTPVQSDSEPLNGTQQRRCSSSTKGDAMQHQKSSESHSNASSSEDIIPTQLEMFTSNRDEATSIKMSSSSCTQSPRQAKLVPSSANNCHISQDDTLFASLNQLFTGSPSYSTSSSTMSHNTPANFINATNTSALLYQVPPGPPPPPSSSGGQDQFFERQLDQVLLEMARGGNDIGFPASSVGGIGNGPNAATSSGSSFLGGEDILTSTPSYREPTEFVCPTCCKGFAQKCLLNRHMKIHSRGEKCKCHYCSFETTFKFNLKSHMVRKHKHFCTDSCPIPIGIQD